MTEPRWGLRSPRTAFVAALVMALAVMSAWAIASPLGSSPDENFHLASIWCAGGPAAGACEVRRGSVAVPAEVLAGDCSSQNAAKSGDCAWVIRPGDVRSTPQADVNFFAGHYPNGYYRIANRLVGDNPTWSAILVRLFNAYLCVGLLFATIAMVQLRLRRALVLSWIACVIPLGLFILPSVNPTSWAVTAVGLSWAATLGLIEARSDARRIGLGLILALCFLMALLSRLDAVVLFALGAAAGAALSPRARKAIAASPRVAVLAASIGAMAGVAAVLLGPAAQSARVTDPLGGIANGDTNLLFSNLSDLPNLWAGSFGTGGLGHLDTAMPHAVTVLSLFAVCGIVFVGLGTMWRAKAAVLSVLGAALVLIPLLTLQARGETVGTFLQPRYLLPLVIVTVGVAVLDVGGGSTRLRRAQAWALGAAWIIAASFALHQVLRRYVSGLDVAAWNLNDVREWWWDIPISPVAVWVLGSLAFAGLVLTGLWYLRSASDCEGRTTP